MTNMQPYLDVIRAAFNGSPNKRAKRVTRVNVADEQKVTSLAKVRSEDETGYFGAWSPRSKTYVFGIQCETRAEVKAQLKKHVGDDWRTFEIRKIKRKHADCFRDGLKTKEESQ